MPMDDGTSEAGRPFPEVFPVSLAIEPTAVDHASVRAQIALLGPENAGRQWQRDQIAALQGRGRPTITTASRRHRIDDAFRLPFTAVEGTAKAILTTERVLVRRADWGADDDVAVSELRAVLEPHEFQAEPGAETAETAEAAEPGETGETAPTIRGEGDGGRQGDPNPLLRLTYPKPLRADELTQIFGTVRRRKMDISLEHIIPCNVVLKSKSAIKSTKLSVPYPPQWIRKDDPIVVAVIDTGVSVRSRIDRWLYGTETIANMDPLDEFPKRDGYLDFAAGHGTFVAGVIALVSPTTKIKIYRAIDSDGIGSEVTVGAAIKQAAADGAQIINLSLGTETIDQSAPLGLAEAFEFLALHHPDVLVVAAAGNSGSTDPTWPSAFPGVVSVGALAPDRKPAGWSNHGRGITLWTIGEGILSTFVLGTEESGRETGPGSTFDVEHLWGIGCGTSFAAPQITGAIARLLQDPHRTELVPPVANARDAVEHLRLNSFPVTDQFVENGATVTITCPGVELQPGITST